MHALKRTVAVYTDGCQHSCLNVARLAHLTMRLLSSTPALCDCLAMPRWDPIKTAKTSFLGTLNMLGLAKRCRARMLISSTSEVYGDPLQHPQTESYWGNVNPIGERSCYDEGRCLGELALNLPSRDLGMCTPDD